MVQVTHAKIAGNPETPRLDHTDWNAAHNVTGTKAEFNTALSDGDFVFSDDSRLSDARTPLSHSHVAADVTNFSEAVDDRVAALLVAGMHINIVYDDAANTITISGTGGGGGGSAKQIIRAQFDGQGSVPPNGTQFFFYCPYGLTINSWALALYDASGAPVSGDAVVDIWKDTNSNYPPVVGDSITASAKPAVTGANRATSSTLTGWTTSIAAGDWLVFNLDSVTIATRVELWLEVTQ